ncbi:ROK family transcriptional regulator [Micromonospora sp. NPDC000668]|uniref:ROK family transcriptional regulator n=1 Tax=Micromonospora sp. NPDC000668 TaxID=3364219 RepID=UPI00368CD023
MTPPDVPVIPSHGTTGNERLVLAALRGGVVLSRAELSATTGLPKTTVTGIANRLLQRGMVVEHTADAGRRHQGRGRPASGLALADPGGLVAVLSFSHTTIRAAAVGWDGTLAAYRAIDIHGDRDQQRLTDQGLGLLAEAFAETGSTPEQAGFAVIGVPAAFEQGVGAVFGQVPDATRKAVPELEKLFGWFRSDPVPTVTERLGIPAMAENYANLAALGEATAGAGRGLDDFIYIKLVEGVGAGLILGGRLHRGARGLAGELAHVQVVRNGRWCLCGSRGCLAATYGGFMESIGRSTYPRPLSAADIRGLAAAGEVGTRRILADLGRGFGRALADVCVMLSPEAIIVDGMLGAAAEPFLTGMRDAIDHRMPSVMAQAVQLLPGALGERAEMLGAVALARAGQLPAATAGW